VSEYDPYSSAYKDDPYPYLAELRSRCPVHHHRLSGVDVNKLRDNPLVARPTEEFWTVVRYDDCVEILQDTKRFSRKEGPGPERLRTLNEDGMLLYADDPAHMVQRRLVNKAFTPRMVELIKPRIQAIADDLVDQLGPAGEAELWGEFAVPMTIRVLAGVVGAGDDRVDDLWRWGNATVAAFGGGEGAAEAGFVAMMELFEFLMEIINERREMLARGIDPPEDVLTALITAEHDGRSFSDDEILMAAQQLLTAGFETTSTATANAIYRLCTNPAERAKLEADWSLLDAAVEEVLRYDAPVDGLFVTTKEPVEIAGCPIPAGAKVRFMYASANRDEGHFGDPDEFRIDRDPLEIRRHLSFGHGAHACVGAAMARAELRAAIQTLLTRLPGLQLHPTRPAERNRSFFVNGFSSLPVVWDPAAVRPADRRPATSAAI
jgi:hypothetical protein